jgi:ribosomal protein L14E/L6E/L27E
MQTGSVVLSLSGRDKDTFLAVTGTDERYIYVCDGKARPLHNPKRKNPKHVQPTEKCLSEAALHSDKSLRKALAIAKSEIESRR